MNNVSLGTGSALLREVWIHPQGLAPVSDACLHPPGTEKEATFSFLFTACLFWTSHLFVSPFPCLESQQRWLVFFLHEEDEGGEVLLHFFCSICVSLFSRFSLSSPSLLLSVSFLLLCQYRWLPRSSSPAEICVGLFKTFFQSTAGSCVWKILKDLPSLVCV